ncbi:histone chaperone asf1 [Drosophila miranda]|uniref:histone chaperone asf1 n=1 Tax=Drosophila miranda TaxID=7229 RepID=UPI0007E72FD4|nr:histone chaperone asf1 [Drosophila miranda]
MLGNKKSKLLQTLEQSVPPVDREDAIRLIAEGIRKPATLDPIDSVDSQKEHLRVLHMDHALKLQQTMERHYNVSPSAEDLDQVMPVKDQELEDILDALSDMASEEEYDEEEEDDDEDEGDGEGDQYDGDDEDEKSPGTEDDRNTVFDLNKIVL